MIKYSLRTRLVLSFLAIIVATAGLVLLLASRITANRFTYMVSRAGQMRAHNLAPWFADYYAQMESWDGVETLVESYLDVQWRSGRHGQHGGMPMMGMMEASEERLLLVDADGQLVADSADEDLDIRLSDADLGKGTPIVVRERQVGTLIIASSLGALTPDQVDFLKQVDTLMLVTAVAAGLGILIVGSFQARRIVAPVRALVEAAGRVAGGDLSQRIPVTSQDELGEMAAAFNTMATELERQQDLRHRAMADIAHELRTPLSVLQIELESIEDGLTTPTPEVIAGLQTDVAHLRRLVEDLRTLSLAEAGELQMEVEPVEMGDLIRNVVNRVQGTARAQGVALDVQLPDMTLVVSGDDQRLAQVLLNLLSNALQHTPSDGQIMVSARYIAADARKVAADARQTAADARQTAADARQTTADARQTTADARQTAADARQIEREVHVTVQDTGEGIPAQDLPHVFDRFYRGDNSRSRATGGLGLSIVKQLVEAHGGRIWAHSVEGEGSAFTFALPLIVEPRDVLMR